MSDSGKEWNDTGCQTSTRRGRQSSVWMVVEGGDKGVTVPARARRRTGCVSGGRGEGEE